MDKPTQRALFMLELDLQELRRKLLLAYWVAGAALVGHCVHQVISHTGG
jgi:hypothetical protein